MQCFDTFCGFLHKLYAATMDGKGREGTYNFFSRRFGGSRRGRAYGTGCPLPPCWRRTCGLPSSRTRLHLGELERVFGRALKAVPGERAIVRGRAHHVRTVQIGGVAAVVPPAALSIRGTILAGIGVVVLIHGAEPLSNVVRQRIA